MKTKKILLLILITFLISSCRGGKYKEIMESAVKAKLADSNPHPIFDGEEEPAFPDPDENDKTILGIDTNKNGIRDDIDIWINRNAINSNERRAFRQLARAMKEELKALEENDVPKFLVMSKNLDKATVCYNVISVPLRSDRPLKEILDDVRSPFPALSWLTNNSTEERQEIRLRSRKISYASEMFRGGWKECEFELEDKEKTITP